MTDPKDERTEDDGLELEAEAVRDLEPDDEQARLIRGGMSGKKCHLD